MVGVEADHRVVVLAGILQHLDQPSDLVVNHGDHAGRQGHRLAKLLLAETARRGLGARAVALLPLVIHPPHGRRGILMRLIGQFDLEIIRIIHVPVFPGRVKRVVRVWKGYIGKERGIAVLLRADPVSGLHPDIAGRVEFLGNRCAIGLRTGVVMRQLFRRVLHGLPVRTGLAEPLLEMTAAFVAMTGHHIDMLETEIGKIEGKELIALI